MKMVKVDRVVGNDYDLTRINELLKQQSPGDKRRLISREEIEIALNNPNFYLIAARDVESGMCVGMGTIFFQRNLARWVAEIHDVVVDEAWRGWGTGEAIVRELMNIAHDFSRKQNIKIKLFLTSRPTRVAANALYVKLGFVLVAQSFGPWGTNLYKIIVEPKGFRGLP